MLEYQKLISSAEDCSHMFTSLCLYVVYTELREHSSFGFLFSLKDYLNLKYLNVQKSNQLSGSPAKSGPLDFGTKNNFPSFFVSEKGLTHIKKQFIIFQFLIFALLRAKIELWPNSGCPTVIRKVKFTDFVRRATSPKMQLTEFRFHTNFKSHSLL